MPTKHAHKDRILRDPIHGNIELTPLQAAVVDTREFQRLRYIRQNGLLHFIFPGAVHTRFAHSLGAMYLAGKAFSRVTKPLLLKTDIKTRESLEYLLTCFQLAALLHDVGHCAFSHSIERVKVNGKPFFGTVQSFLSSWNEDELWKELSEVEENVTVYGEKPIHHEEIGFVLIRRIFRQEQVQQATLFDGKNVAKDVVALVHGRLGQSPAFIDAAFIVYQGLASAQIEDVPDKFTASAQMLRVLHDLISGTLDVDRLDYLVRDSRHCGVTYGLCDVDFLLSSLRISFVAGDAVLAIQKKAENSLEDMLWSRYQLFVQVLNHKTNVALNAKLGEALQAALDDDYIQQPQDPAGLLSFTDDYVMSNVLRIALKGKKDERAYTKALIDRRFPVQLGYLDLLVDGNEGKQKQDEYRNELANRYKVKPDDIFCVPAKSELVKPSHPLFTVSADRLTGKFETRSLEFSTLKRHLEHSLLHFFCDRDKLA